MLKLNEFDFSNKVVLEIGTGRGDTTVELAQLMSKYKNAKLISTDVFDGNFNRLKEEIKKYNVNVKFVKTNACDLSGIENCSI